MSLAKSVKLKISHNDGVHISFAIFSIELARYKMNGLPKLVLSRDRSPPPPYDLYRRADQLRRLPQISAMDILDVKPSKMSRNV